MCLYTEEDKSLVWKLVAAQSMEKSNDFTAYMQSTVKLKMGYRAVGSVVTLLSQQSSLRVHNCISEYDLEKGGKMLSPLSTEDTLQTMLL